MKKCPFCAEQIQDEAIVCRYCGRDLQQTSLNKKDTIPPIKPKDISSKSIRSVWAIGAIWATCLTVISLIGELINNNMNNGYKIQNLVGDGLTTFFYCLCLCTFISWIMRKLKAPTWVKFFLSIIIFFAPSCIILILIGLFVH